MKRLFFILTACAMTALPVFAAAPAKPAKKKKTPAPAASEPAFKVSTSAPQNLAELIAHFQEIDKNLLTLSASFTQSLAMPQANMTQQTEGTLRYLKPNRIRLEHSKPERQTIVSDGSTIWIHRLEQNQVIESLLADWKKADPLLNNLLDFGNYSQLLANYDVAYDSGTLRVVLRPKEKTDQPFTLSLTLVKPYFFPMETELDVTQTQVRTILSDVRFNAKLQDSLFRFKAPPGAQVFDHFKPPTRGQESQ